MFSFPPRKTNRPSHRVFNKININKDNNQSFIAKLKHILEHKIAQAAMFIRVSLANMPKKDLKSLAALLILLFWQTRKSLLLFGKN